MGVPGSWVCLEHAGRHEVVGSAFNAAGGDNVPGDALGQKLFVGELPAGVERGERVEVDPHAFDAVG